LVGYQNGSLDVITPDGITYVVDIPIATGYNGSKKSTIYRLPEILL
jgi:hypothetical protein